MPSAREVLAEADALIRRNRARVVDDEIPELTEAVTEELPAPESVPAPAPTTLDEVPELTDAVEEIEITSIAEMPESEREAPALSPAAAQAVTASSSQSEALPLAVPAEAGVTVFPDPDPEPTLSVPPGGPPEVPLDAVRVDAIQSSNARADKIETAPIAESDVASAESLMALSRPIVQTRAVDSQRAEVRTDGDLPLVAPAIAPPEAAIAEADNWARWEALGDEVRMQVLQRIELFAGRRLPEELSARLQPIVERASAQLLTTINEQIAVLLRAHVAQAIEREIERRRRGEP